MWLRERTNRFRGSLFGVPALFVVGAIVLSTALVELDRRLDEVSLPTFVTSTVDSSRSLLGAITSGTISAASVVFSLTLVAIQLSSSTYSSRVVRTFLRDRFQQNVIGLVMGTFAYSMLVLRVVRGPLEEDGGSPFVPRFSILLATLLALVSLLALIASINHTAQNLRVSTITRQLVDDFKEAIETSLPREPDGDDATRAPAGPTRSPDQGGSPHHVGPLSPDLPAGPGTVLTAATGGWVQQISLDAIRAGVPGAETVRVDVTPGAYVYAGSPLLTVWPQPELDDVEETQDHLRDAFAIGSERSLQQDLAFGFVLLEDIAVRALSPGVNDPNTAREVIPQLGEVLLDVLSRPLPPIVSEQDGFRIHRPLEAGYDDYVRAAFLQIRRCASGQPEVMASIIGATKTVVDELARRGQGSPSARSALAGLVGDLADDLARAELAPVDRQRLTALIEQLHVGL